MKLFHFIKHKHDPQKVDEVLCIIDDVGLPVKTIEIKQLKLWHQLTGDDLVDFFKLSPDAMLVMYKTGEAIYHFQDDWLRLTKEKEMRIRENLRKNNSIR